MAKASGPFLYFSLPMPFIFLSTGRYKEWRELCLNSMGRDEKGISAPVKKA